MMKRFTEEEVHVIRLDKGDEHYVCMYDKRHTREMLHRLSQWATNPNLSFSWYDAARLSHEVRSSR